MCKLLISLDRCHQRYQLVSNRVIYDETIALQLPHTAVPNFESGIAQSTALAQGDISSMHLPKLNKLSSKIAT